MAAGTWRIAIDRGGTFTDVVAKCDGETRHAKVLSNDAIHGENAAVVGIRLVLGLAADTPIDQTIVREIRLGTTVATNALLTRSGRPIALVVTKGLGDLPIIGDQTRPDLFALDIKRPPPLANNVIEVRERIASDGEIVQPLDETAVTKALQGAFDAGVSSVAITLMHGWKHEAHERRIAQLAQGIGFELVCRGADSPLRGLLRRIDTLSLDASLTSVLRDAVDAITQSVGGAPVYCMQSNGGLVVATRFRGSSAILSGPAGGLIGAQVAARTHGLDKIVAFDMGGTSTDVSWSSGTLERVSETMVAGVRIAAPMLAIHTVASGGGSICSAKGGRLRIGPDSAGADPGPACYGRGGPATITDCHVVLGRLPIVAMPNRFGPSGDEPLDADASTAVLREISMAAGVEGITHAAAGLLDVAVERIAAATREVSVQQGHDPREAALVAFGGAGGQLACRVAQRLGMSQVLFPREAGVLSAVGIAAAPISAVRRRSVEQPLGDAGMDQLGEMIAIADTSACEELMAAAVHDSEQIIGVAIRAVGWDQSIMVPLSTAADMAVAFRNASRSRFGFEALGDLIIESVEVQRSLHHDSEFTAIHPQHEHTPSDTRMWIQGEWQNVPVLRDDCFESVEGPAVIIHDGATSIIEPGWHATRCADGSLLATHGPSDTRQTFDASDPAHIEVFNRRFLSICREMGTVLRHTATSINIRERQDYSCAIFDAAGSLVANGPHIPVHLGSMGASVSRVLEVHGDTMRDGDAYLINDPATGGTHLPDLTVVSPVFERGQLSFIVASRAHHVDVGGTTPGSMPPDSTQIDEEGVVFDAVPVLMRGVLQEAAIVSALTESTYPARLPSVVLDDLRSQLAANARGRALLEALMAEVGSDGLAQSMQAIRANAARCVREAIARFSCGRAEVPTDDGGCVCVEIEPTADGIRIDFAGTSPQRPGNTNAPEAVVRAAVLYVLRCVVADDIPLNDGCLDPVEIRIPKGSMLSPLAGAAVVGGNVETSQIVADALLMAFGLQAGSQGTMNNLTFGTANWQYYETICGGGGAGEHFDGGSGVHTHMTNSRMTDPEVLEDRFPIRLEEFAIRRGSGGLGSHAGGDGVVRSLRFLQEAEVSLLSGRRKAGPPGIHGGGSGVAGQQFIQVGSGKEQPLGGTFRVPVDANTIITIETPGGGGFGQE